MSARFRIGTSGWQYDHWRGRFYPEALPKREWFAHYARVFDTVEVNATFYRLPEVKTVAAWREAARPGFRFALKFSRFATHRKRLKDPAQPIGLFLDRARHLGAHLGPILVQLPPRFRADPGRLHAFLEAAPAGLRWAVEVRDARWLRDDVFAVLRRHGASLVIHDLIEDHPRVETADWSYLRFHGGRAERYRGTYPRQALVAEARRVEGELSRGRDVHAYFNNDLAGHAVTDALDLKRYVFGGEAVKAPSRPQDRA
jgi:uncharacterized protein YecE (DUF72 family)